MSSFTEIGADASLTMGLWTVTKEIFMQVVWARRS